MWSVVSNAALQGKLVRLVHAATDAQPFIAANLRQLRWLVGWISDVERQLPGVYSGNSEDHFRCKANVGRHGAKDSNGSETVRRIPCSQRPLWPNSRHLHCDVQMKKAPSGAFFIISVTNFSLSWQKFH